eukprot:gene11032-13049_t
MNIGGDGIGGGGEGGGDGLGGVPMGDAVMGKKEGEALVGETGGGGGGEYTGMAVATWTLATLIVP